jgi:calcineurin-like phosphoesterase family protein
MNYFTADQHFGHRNIMRYCKRPFETTQDMDATIVEKHNAVVTAEDTVYHIGDFVMCRPDEENRVAKIVKKLNGTHILIWGNHDGLKPLQYIEAGFQSAHTSLVMGIGDHIVVLCHDPAVATVRIDRLWLCGHVHGLFKTIGNVVNVGVDVWNFAPVSEKELEPLVKEFYYV